VVDWKPEKATYPGFMQPKLNGIRATLRVSLLQPGQVVVLSRRGKPLNLPHLVEAAKVQLRQGDILDGELYADGLSFQEICSLVKRNQPGSEKIGLWVFDLPCDAGDAAATFESRLARLRYRSQEWSHPFHMVPTIEVQHPLEVKQYYERCLVQGYEGAIYRARDGGYPWGGRPTTTVMRLKPTFDAEYTIVGFKEGTGRDKGCVVWICQTENGKRFKVRPKGSVEVRRLLFQQAMSYIGGRLKVEFKGLSEDGVPRHPVGIGIRLPEDY